MSTQLLDLPVADDPPVAPQRPGKRRWARYLVIASLVTSVAATGLAVYEYTKVAGLEDAQRQQGADIATLRTNMARMTLSSWGSGNDLGSRLDDLESRVDDVESKVGDVDSRADCLDGELSDVSILGLDYTHGSC